MAQDTVRILGTCTVVDRKRLDGPIEASRSGGGLKHILEGPNDLHTGCRIVNLQCRSARLACVEQYEDILRRVVAYYLPVPYVAYSR